MKKRPFALLKELNLLKNRPEVKLVDRILAWTLPAGVTGNLCYHPAANHRLYPATEIDEKNTKSTFGWEKLIQMNKIKCTIKYIL